MLDIYLHDGSQSLTFQLAGKLADPGAAELAQSWTTAASILNGKQLVVDLTKVTEIDASGEHVLDLLGKRGARFITASPPSDALARKISGHDPAELPPLRVAGWRKLLCLLRQRFPAAHVSFLQRMPCFGPVRRLW
jgi:anti-anti-sigma regulatory factor